MGAGPSLPRIARVSRVLLLLSVLVAGCVTAPEIPREIRKETRCVRAGEETVSVDFYYRPVDQPRPFVVVVHGFLANKERMAHWGVLLAEEGFVAAVPTNPTFANDNRNASAIVALVEAGRSGHWPVPMQNDGRAVLVGFSRGGYETLLAAAELGNAVDAWIGLDPVDRDGKGMAAARKARLPGLALLADPAPLNANGNAHRMLSAYAGPLEISHVPGAGHLDAESPGRNGRSGLFRSRALAFLERAVPRD